MLVALANVGWHIVVCAGPAAGRPLVMVRRVCFCVLPARAAARQWS